MFALSVAAVRVDALKVSAPTTRTQKRASVVVRAEADAAADEYSALKPTSVKDFKDMSNEAIIEEVVKCKKMLFQLRMRQSTRKEYKPHHFGILKTKVAQLYTVKREREIAEGVNMRDSRELKRKDRVANIYL
ncbi:Ribosomal protein L29 [Ostreococcus tauri]|uniref:Large ribosomal subunit protein uL29c n=1 Tax=Ostreococcus tauri TaxID=70448 RepID=A0A090M280_OSTTA|nr:Ribosomal protein L29 [Ostreococcus tauri]CEF98306.1 Ribosomal protein L29 [Ostreococcus tauri]|eukprot:XP_022839196.1 Ribosomal protein L29 [Ostreococcus tauri]